MSNALIEKWQAAARALPEAAIGSLNMPLHVAFAEGEQVAYFADNYWQAPKDDASARSVRSASHHRLRKSTGLAHGRETRPSPVHAGIVNARVVAEIGFAAGR